MLWRLSDPVAVLDREARAERHLYHFDKRARLREGDGLRQGVAGTSELRFADRSTIRHFGETLAWMDSLAPSGAVIRYERLRRLIADVRDRAPVSLVLAGGYEIRARGTFVRVTLDVFERGYRVRNAGPGPVEVRGPTGPGFASAIDAGHEVFLPLVDDPEAVLQTERTRPDDVILGRTLRIDGQVAISGTGDERTFSGDGMVRLGGARIRIPAGKEVRVFRPRPSRPPELLDRDRDSR